MTHRRKINLVIVGTVLLFAVFVTAMYAPIGNPFDPFDDCSFTPAAWRAANPRGRASMCRDLISKHLIAGTSERQVVALLGNPDEVCKAVKGHRCFGIQTYIYSIGSWSNQGMDDAFLYVHLDANDQVIFGEIYGY